MDDYSFTVCDLSKQLLQLQKCFLSVYDLKLMKWDEILDEFNSDYNVSQKNQELLLQTTVKHPLVLKYPIKLSYQQCFLKKFIFQLEKSGLEVSENIYSFYVDLLNKTDENVLLHYRHFLLPNKKYVSLCERKNFISDGTTGLFSWQGSFALSEWIIENINELKGKTVLELGSGTGLAGLILLKYGNPSRYYFSDCHPEVLKQLRYNVILNNQNYNESDFNQSNGNEDFCWQTVHDGSLVSVLNLSWERINDYNLDDVNPDIIIASDVVYDESLFTPLCDTLQFFLQRFNLYALFVCTVRNELTFKRFVELLKSRKCNVSYLSPVRSNHIPFSLETPIKFLKIENEKVFVI